MAPFSLFNSDIFKPYLIIIIQIETYFEDSYLLHPTDGVLRNAFHIALVMLIPHGFVSILIILRQLPL